MMVIARLIAGFLLLFGLATLAISIAFSYQGSENYAVVERNFVVTERKVKQTTIENVNLGRKMIFNYNVTKEERKKEIDSKNTKKSRMLKARGSYQARLVAFNADYKGPRHHPPKNN